jgi:hypothetical protein
MRPVSEGTNVVRARSVPRNGSNRQELLLMPERLAGARVAAQGVPDGLHGASCFCTSAGCL